jgi:hypothetical protein
LRLNTPHLSFYISYRGFYATTRPPRRVLLRSRPWVTASHALWVGEDCTWPPCPRSGRSAPRAAARRAPWGARKRHRSGWANDTRLAPPACSEPPERAGMDTGPAQRQPCGPGGHVPHMHRILLGEIRWRPPKRGFSCSSPPDTRRSRPAHPAESPKRRGGGRRAQHDHTFHYEGRCLPPPPPKPHGPRFGTSRGAWASLGGALE